MYDDKKTCSACGGRCCKTMPGCAYPEDFGQALEKLDSALASGRWAIDWWEGDPRPGKDEMSKAYFVRPAVKGHEGRIYHGAWGGECTFLGPYGCELASDERPRECRHLEPLPEGVCEMHGDCGKQSAAIAWIPHAEALETPNGKVTGAPPHGV